jgi:hypothetical protein
MDLSNNASHFDTKLCQKQKFHQMSEKKQSKKRSESTTSTTTSMTKMVCLASAVFMGIPVVQGFAPSGQSEFRVLRQQLSDLKYRVHDNSEERQCQHRKATAKLLARTSKHTNNEPKHHVVSNFFHTWWTASKSRRAHEQALAYAEQQEQQLILDNYLESIDRRYKRLHKDHKRKDHDSDTVKNVAWNFLMNSESVDYVEEQRRQMDAIYVLGLAELASERLLQKHNLPLPQSKHKDKSIIDVQSTQEFDVNQPTTPLRTEDSAIQNIKVEAASLKILATTTYFVQLLKCIQDAYRNRLLSLLDASKTTIVGSLKSSRKAIGTTLSTTANRINVSGEVFGKYAMNFVYIFAATLMANAVTVLRLMVKA